MGNNLTPEAKAARRAYMKEYRSSMSDEAREQKNAHLREWRRRNPDKIRQYNAEYWERKAQKCERETIEKAVCRLHKEGLSLREIGEHLNISHMKVSRILHDNEID